ncbi:response regulator [Gracilimonas sp.]|uniref:response regulator n=1 Tax=Gracilimonas sp. TaxID=1974203 RepID=UPI003BAA2922
METNVTAMKGDISKKAIIVEDNLILSLLYENYLKEMVFKTVGEITSGEKAVELVKKYTPDVVIMDIMLNGSIDGIQAAQEIRKFSQAPIVFITGNSDTAHVDRAKMVSNSKFLKKPISEDKLKKAVNYLLSDKPKV